MWFGKRKVGNECLKPVLSKRQCVEGRNSALQCQSTGFIAGGADRSPIWKTDLPFPSRVHGVY